MADAPTSVSSQSTPLPKDNSVNPSPKYKVRTVLEAVNDYRLKHGLNKKYAHEQYFEDAARLIDAVSVLEDKVAFLEGVTTELCEMEDRVERLERFHSPRIPEAFPVGG